MKSFLRLLLFIFFWAPAVVLARQPSPLSPLIGRIQNNPADTLAWMAFQTFFDTTSLPPEQLGLYLKDALDSFDPQGDSRLKGELLRQRGISAMDQGEYQQSSAALMEALRLFEASADLRGQANTRVNLGALNYYLNQFDAAIQYWEQAARFFEAKGPHSRLGTVFSNIGSVFSEMNRLDSAEAYHRRALAIHEKAQDRKGMAQVWNNLGVTNEYAGRFPEALRCYRKARLLCDNLGDTAGVVRAELNGATILEYQHKYAEALAANRRALALVSHSGEKGLYRLAFLNLAGLYNKMGRYREAYESLEKYHAYKDSLINEENTRYIQNLQIVHETEQKEKEIALLSRTSEAQAWRLKWQRLLTAGFLLIALLLGALVWMIRRHQKRTDALLHNILPAAVAFELRHTGQVQPKRHESVTVLFADLVGFTELGHTLPPEALVGLIDRYYRAFDEIIDRHGIEKIKTIGDSYMCVSGLPNPNPKHADSMFRAASEMLYWVRENGARPAGVQHLELRVGMHSGPVVAGVVGKSKYAYDIWGDTVNTAARMEQFGVPGRINLSEATRLLLTDTVELNTREQVEVKGIGKMRMYVAEF